MTGPWVGTTASLFGRDMEMARVRELVDAARHGGSRTLLVVGRAGVGKTSLVRRMVDESTAEGVLVLWGAGMPMATLASPFRTVRGMLRDLPPGRYWFHHPLQAELLEAAAHPEDRRAWHERIAILLRAALERGDDPVDAAVVVARADHYAAAGMASEAYAWSLLVAAGLEGRTSAADVVRALRRALEFRETAGASDPSVEDLLVRLRAATVRAGDLWGELEAVERLLEVVARNRRPEVAAELVIRRMQLRAAGRVQELGLSEAEEAVALAARRPDSWQYALAMAMLADVLDYRDAYAVTAAVTEDGEAHDRGARASNEAVLLAERAGNHRALAHALAAAVLYALRRRPGEGSHPGAPGARGRPTFAGPAGVLANRRHREHGSRPRTHTAEPRPLVPGPRGHGRACSTAQLDREDVPARRVSRPDHR